MRRLSMARVLSGALLGIALTLAAITGLGIAALYHDRQRYEDQLSVTSALEVASSDMVAAGVAEEAQFRAPPGARDQRAVERATATYAAAAAQARQLSDGDPDGATTRLLGDALQAERAARTLARRPQTGAGGRHIARLIGQHLGRARRASVALSARQVVRREAARRAATSSTRRALVAIVLSGSFALLAVLLLVAALIRAMRSPLGELLAATRRLAGGDLASRVSPAGPRELQTLGEAFNRMGADLAGTTAQLDAERERLSITIESLGDGLILCEAGGEVAAVNPRAVELVPELRPGGRADGPASPLPGLRAALGGEVIVERTDGRTLAITAARLGAPGPATGAGVGGGVIWTVRDVTERARLERAKTEFVATASHELRSPLTSIKGYIELLGTTGGLSERQAEFVKIIALSANRLTELVNDLLDVAKIEAGNVELYRRSTDLRDVVREAAELIRPRLVDKHQALELDIDQALPPALVDPGRVRQIVTNLLTNAHLYTNEGGRIDVRLRAGAGGLSIGVSDTGRGMSPEERARVYERFYRGEGPRSERGTGLGLAIVKSLVDLHHGRIDLESQLGVGTTFTVTLPRAPIDIGRTRVSAIAGRRVLVVDDEPKITELIAENLTRFGVESVCVHSGAEALARLRTSHFDAVTLDVLMPGMDGIETLREIRADPGLRRVPAVFVSVFADHGSLEGEWVVSKPIDSAELGAVLSVAVASGRTRVLAVGRDAIRERLSSALDRLGVEYRWESSGPAAARACEIQRFEVALIDAGLRSPEAIVESVDLRGRRTGRAMIFFAGPGEPTPTRSGAPVLPVEQAALAVRAALGDIEQGPGSVRMGDRQ
jgi:signal transduction histidine kinase/AmiR/NasT family two-component response regulator